MKQSSKHLTMLLQHLSVACCLVATLFSSAFSYAKTSNSDQVSGAGEEPRAELTEELIVVGGFQSENLQKVSAGVSLINGQQLAREQVDQLEQTLKLAPNVNFASGSSRGRYIQIRGIGERGEFIAPVNHSVGVIIDGIDFTGVSGAASTLDIKQIEVFRGPQGTLYGANALAGLINLISETPSIETKGNLALSVGNYNYQKVTAAIGGSLSENLGARVAIQSNRSDGYTNNIFLNRGDTNNFDETSARVKFKLDASENLTLGATIYLANVDNGYDAFSFDNNRNTRSDQPGEDSQDTTAIALTSTSKWSEQNTVWETSLSHASSDIVYSYDEDWSNPELCQLTLCPFGDYSSFDSYDRDYKNLSLDSRLISDSSSNGSNDSDETYQWVIGIYHRDQEQLLGRDYTYAAAFNSQYDTENTAIYAEYTYALSADLELSIGGRIERRSASYLDNQGFNFGVSESLWGGKISLRKSFNDNQSGYILASRGYKPGGSNPTDAIPVSLREYDTETMFNYETGLKGVWLNGQLRAQLALFLQDRDDVQTDNSLVTCAIGGFPCRFDDYINNAAAGTSKGLEAEFTWHLGEQLLWTTSLGLLNTEYNDLISFTHIDADESTGTGVNLDHRELAHAPSYTLHTSLRWNLNDELSIAASIEGKDRFYFSDSHEEQSDSYQLIHLQMEYEMEQLAITGIKVQGWIKNLTDKDIQTRGFGSFGNDPRNAYTRELYYQLGEPRTFGISVHYAF